MPIKGIEIEQIMTMSYENISTRAANKVEFLTKQLANQLPMNKRVLYAHHSRLRGSLLRLEEHRFGFTTARAELVGSGKL